MILDAEKKGAITPGKVNYNRNDACSFMDVIISSTCYDYNRCFGM